MKVAYILGKLDTGGTEKLALDIFSYLPINGIEFVGIYRKDGQLTNEFSATGIPVYKIPVKNVFDILYFFRLRKLLIQLKVDIAHAHQPIDALLVYFATIGSKTKTVFSLHGFGTGYGRLYNLLRNIALKIVNLRIFVSNSQFEIFAAKFPWLKNMRNCIVHNGFLNDKFNKPAESDIRREFNISEDKVLMGSVGNFNSGRNQLFICQVLSDLNKKFSDFHFFFVGERNPRETWRFDQCVDFCKANNLANVHFTGTRSDVPSILGQLDAFVYHSDHDTFGIAVIEAMAAGISVFVNNWKAMLEITENGEYANIYCSKDELLKLLIDFIEHPGEFKNAALKSSKLVREKYSIKFHIKNLHSAYSELL